MKDKWCDRQTERKIRMKGRVGRIAAAGTVLAMLLLCLLYAGRAADNPQHIQSDATDGNPQQGTRSGVTAGTEFYKGFLMDNVLHAGDDGDIHFHIYVPDSYDGVRSYPLFLTMSGYGGMYFQGMGANLTEEPFALWTKQHFPEMIIVAPQMEAWGENYADQVLALMEYLLSAYRVDEDRIYAEAFSAGGVTMSFVLEERPDLFCAYLHCCSSWPGDPAPVVKERLPVYIAVGERDEYFGAEPSGEIYDELYGRYRQQGLSEEEIDEILVLDVKDAAYFSERDAEKQHDGGVLFGEDPKIMGWLFGFSRSGGVGVAMP